MHCSQLFAVFVTKSDDLMTIKRLSQTQGQLQGYSLAVEISPWLIAGVSYGD